MRPPSGGAGNDTLSGGDGADKLIGGAGDDVYYADEKDNSIVENSSEGIDTLYLAAMSSYRTSYTLVNNVENLVMERRGSAYLYINASGNSLGNKITGNDYENLLQGVAGADTLFGMEGDDTLDGGSDIDSLVGGVGNDTYIVDSASDVILEQVSEGFDIIQAAVSYVLSADVESLVLTGSSLINGTGNSGDNQLTGNSAINLLDGAAGNDTFTGATAGDTLKGGLGDDTFVLDTTTSVTLLENSGEGTDTVQSSLTVTTLAANVENLVLTGANAINGTGNELANPISGNTAGNTLSGANGNDTLDGGAGLDTLVGGTRNDVYIVDAVGDVVTEDASAGNDTIRTSVTLSGLGLNVENLELLGGEALNGTGNDLYNRLTGNAAGNVLSGLVGQDTLDGGAGADTMAGGTQNDIYVVDDYGDVVTENASEGTDTIQTYVTLSSLVSNVENVLLLGSDALNATGNSAKNTLTGNAAANTLDGSTGNDTLVGGAGDGRLPRGFDQ